MKNEVRPIDANALAEQIKRYMRDYRNAPTRLTVCRSILSMLGDERQTPTIEPESAHIDREAWEPCELCAGERLDEVGFADHFGLRVYLRGGNNKPPKNERFQFCPKCGRPRTEEAWAELEKRLRG